MKDLLHKCNWWIHLSMVIVFVLSVSDAHAQVVLYMEMMGEAKPIKYYEGQSWRILRIYVVQEAGPIR